MKKIFSVFGVCLLICGMVLSGCSSKQVSKVQEPVVVKVTDQEMTLKLAVGERTGKYTGDTIEGIPNGQGRFDTANLQGQKWYYEGAWVNGDFSGQGKCVWESGQIIEGTYINGRMNGLGSRTNDKGIKMYEGSFKDDKYDGTGKLLNKDGQPIYEGDFVNGIPKEDVYKPLCKIINYKEIARNPDKYFGQAIKYSGKAVQVIEGEKNDAYLRIAVDGDYDSIVRINYTRKDGESRVLEDDMVTIWGVSHGIFTYESTMGGAVSIPWVDAYYLQID